LKRACKNYNELLSLGLVEDHTLHRERAETVPEEERAEALDTLEEYDKLVEAFRKFAESKALQDFKGWAWGENFVKWAGKERISVGYSGVERERAAEYFIMDIPLEYELPPDRTVADLYELYRLTYLADLRIPTQTESESLLVQFLEYTKKWPRSWLGWLVKNVYPLTDESSGFWTVVTKILALVSLRDVWEEILHNVEGYIEDELKKTPQFEVLMRMLGDWEASRDVRKWIEDVKTEIVEKYASTTEDPDKVKDEFFARAREVFSERVAPESKILEVYEEIKPLIPPEKVALTRGGLLEAIRWAFLRPQSTVEGFASVKIFPLMFTTEQAKEIAAKILEKVAKKPAAPPPKAELAKIKALEDLPAIVGADFKTYGPFKKGEVYELPKENAEAFVKRGVATYMVAIEERDRELAQIKSHLERLGKFERLAFFLNNRLTWRYITIADQKEILNETVKGWTDKDYQTFYDMYPEKVKEVAPAFSLLGLPIPPPPAVPETAPALKEELEEEKIKRREAEIKAEEEKKKAEAVAVAVEVAPPPIKEPVPAEEQVVRRECYETFSKLWDEIKKAGAMEVGIPTVAGRTGIGASFIRKALAYSYEKQLEKIEKLANELIECQCSLEEKKEHGSGKCERILEREKKTTL
jgi:hypothetical protein